jgi:hypothetical protein
MSNIDYQVIESLGDNCELGFVLRELGCETGSFFRWASANTESVVKLLRHEFHEVYDFNNLQPSYLDMLRDKKYGVAFHTSMKAKLTDSGYSFIEQGDQLKKLYEQDKAKIDYLITKFRKKALEKNTIYVVKANQNLADDTCMNLLMVLKNFCRRNDVKLLVVKASEENAGQVFYNGNFYVGFIARFAPYDKADDVLYEQWFEVLEKTIKSAEFVEGK